MEKPFKVFPLPITGKRLHKRISLASIPVRNLLWFLPAGNIESSPEKGVAAAKKFGIILEREREKDDE
jgi:hypothetical protein